MEVSSAKLTAPIWPVGELPPFRLATLFESFAVQSRVILVIRRFSELLRVAITLGSSLDLLKTSDGPIFSSLVVDRCVFSMIPGTLRGCPSVPPTQRGTSPWLAAVTS